MEHSKRGRPDVRLKPQYLDPTVKLSPVLMLCFHSGAPFTLLELDFNFVLKLL